MRLYDSPRGVPDFQAQGAARAYYCEPHGALVANWATGIGKSHLAMILLALEFEDDRIDVAFVVAEGPKVADDEWLGDFATFTKLDTVAYRGTVEKRRRLLAEGHQVYVTTYETFRNDAARIAEGRKRKLESCFLTTWLEGKRVRIIYDEVTRLGNRKSRIYRFHEHAIDRIRKTGTVYLLGLTEFSMESSVENYFNIGRLFAPALAPTVEAFERDYVRYRDQFGRPAKWKNLSDDGFCEPWVTPLATRFEPIMIYKSDSEPDVRDFFPEPVEEFTHVELDPLHQEFYEAVRNEYIGDTDDPMVERMLFITLRMIAGHPLSLLNANGRFAKDIVTKVGGEPFLRKLGAAKLDAVVSRAIPIVRGEGRQMIIFSFFGPSMFPWISERLRDESLDHAVFSSNPDRDQEKARFKAGDVPILLCSDAGKRGINLPEATRGFNYELPLTYADYRQRFARFRRIFSGVPQVRMRSFIALDTVEGSRDGLRGIEAMVIRRNEWKEALAPDDDEGVGQTTARQRREMMQISRQRTKRGGA